MKCHNYTTTQTFDAFIQPIFAPNFSVFYTHILFQKQQKKLFRSIQEFIVRYRSRNQKERITANE